MKQAIWFLVSFAWVIASMWCNAYLFHLFNDTMLWWEICTLITSMLTSIAIFAYVSGKACGVFSHHAD